MMPNVYPGVVLSEMGRRVKDLHAKGLSNIAIGRHVGCHHEQIRQLVEDPNRSPRYTTGQALIRLHENVMMGISPWGRMIHALRHHGFTYEQIAVQVGASTRHIQDVISKDPAVIPSHDLGERLTQLYRTHVVNTFP